MHKYFGEPPLVDDLHAGLVELGYNASDDLPASAILADGYGQYNTEGTLTIMQSLHYH